MNFYACIIGSEILNGRRADKHFSFVKDELARYGHELFASFIIKDDKELITNIYKLIKSDPDSIMFSFGGIGSTPDDLTRAIAAAVFTSKPLERNKKFEQDIIERFAENAYPYRIFMSDLPQGSKLLRNPVNNMSGFSLQDRYFFTPGFPEMSHPMITDVIEEFFSTRNEKTRVTLHANTSENTLIGIMEMIPSHIELSSLPMLGANGATVDISLSGEDKSEVEQFFKLFTDFLETNSIGYKLI